ncbi:MAG: hypothetical protein JNL21_28880 [Myxococcales bacterium]|nr:hypothetical protein [Myxococcales bacterium]
MRSGFALVSVCLAGCLVHRLPSLDRSTPAEPEPAEVGETTPREASRVGTVPAVEGTEDHAQSQPVADPPRPKQRAPVCVGESPPPSPPTNSCCYMGQDLWQRILAPGRQRVRACLDEAAGRGMPQRGRLVLHIESDRAGSVAKVCDDVDDDIVDERFLRCVFDGFREVALPEATDFCPPVRLNYPLTLGPPE